MMPRALLLFASLLAAMPALAQTPPPAVDLAAVLELARSTSPQLALEAQNVASARADLRSAGAYPNPTLSYTRQHQPGEQTNYSSKRAHDATLEIPLLLAGQRGARIDAAERGVDAARARYAVSGNSLAADAGVAFVALLAAQEKRSVLAAGLDELGRLRDIVGARRDSGMASQYELLRVDVELAAWQTQLAEAEAALAGSQGELAEVLGFPGWQPRGEGALQALAFAADTPQAADNPAIVASRLEEAQAQAEVEVARRERFPEVSISAGRFWTREPFGDTYAVGVSVELPIFDTRQGAVDKARAAALSAGLQRRLAEARVEADIARYQAQVTYRNAALAQFRERTGAQMLPALKQMAEDAYRLGKSPIGELLDASRSRYETQLGQIELVAGLMEAQLRLQAARGAFAGVAMPGE